MPLTNPSVLTGIDGWVDDTANTWTYASGSGGGTATFTVSGDRTAVFSKGTRIKLTQTTVKYFVVIGSSYSAPNTTVTITAGTTYTLANAAISANYYSYEVNPQGYPGWFAYTPTWTSTGTAPSLGNGTLTGRFAIVGKQCTVIVRFLAGSTSTFGTGYYNFSVPVTWAAAQDTVPGVAWVLDSGTLEYIGRAFANSSSATISAQMIDAGVAVYLAQSDPQAAWAASDECRLALTAEF